MFRFKLALWALSRLLFISVLLILYSVIIIAISIAEFFRILLTKPPIEKIPDFSFSDATSSAKDGIDKAYEFYDNL